MAIALNNKKALFWGAAVALYLRFALIPTAVLFYELHHATGIDAVYWGYSLFKGAGYYFGVWAYQTPVCLAVGLLVFLLCNWRQARKLANGGGGS